MLTLTRSLSKSLRKFISPSIKYSFGGGNEPTIPFGDASNVVTDSVQSTIKGFQNVNYVEEHDPSLTEEQKKSMKRFLIYRSNPSVCSSNLSLGSK